MINLIALSGRMGSGKDTAACVIKKLMYHRYKNLYPYLFDTNQENVYNDPSLWHIKKFAGKLKKTASVLLDVPVERFEDRKFKESHLGPEWDNMTVRQFMQKLGTECMRDGLHVNTWVNALFSSFKPYGTSYEHGIAITLQPNWIITDCRFNNEFDAINELGGKIIFIERGDHNTGVHPSEIEMEHFKSKCHYHIDNNYDMDALESTMRIILADCQLL